MPLFVPSVSQLEVIIADQMLADIVSNYKRKGSVWKLAEDYSPCVEGAGDLAS